MFLSKVRAEDRSPYGDFWFEPVTARTLAGMRVSADTALQLSAVFRAVFLISGHLALLPLVIKKPGSFVKVEKHPLYKLFKRPNRWQNGLEWRQMITAHLLLRGNAYNEIIDNSRGEITDLVPLHPDRVKLVVLDNGDYRYKVTDANGTERTLQRGQMWHLRGLSSNGYTGLSVIECARESMGLGLAAQNFGARFFMNDARPTAGWLEYPGTFADKASRTQFKESVQEAQAAANRGKMMVLDRGMKYHEVGLNNRDSQFLETRKFQISDIARWFGVPPHKLADLDRATFSNIEQQSLEYITDALLIWASIWEAGIQGELLFDDEDLEVEFDFDKLARGDSVSRANRNQKLVAAGIITRNEARADERKPPLDGLDEPLRPLNMVEESDAEDEEEDAEPAESDQPPPQKPQEDGDAEARLAQLLQANAGRLARRIIKANEVRPALVAEALAIPLEHAEAWAKNSLWSAHTFTLENLTASLIALGSKSS